jgi:hypothetical protein
MVGLGLGAVGLGVGRVPVGVGGLVGGGGLVGRVPVGVRVRVSTITGLVTTMTVTGIGVEVGESCATTSLVCRPRCATALPDTTSPTIAKPNTTCPTPAIALSTSTSPPIHRR